MISSNTHMDWGPVKMVDRRRVYIILLLFTLGVAAIAGRLFWIQVAAASRFTERNIDLVKNSVLQRQRGLILDSGRGRFVDRSGQALTGEVRRGLLVFPVNEAYYGTAEQRKPLLAILRTGESEWRSFLSGLKEPAWWPNPEGKPLGLTNEQAAQIEKLGIPNVRVAELTIRYPAGMPAAQLIGFVGQNPERVESVFRDQLEKGQLQRDSEIGASGLEKTFEPWLRSLGPTTLSYFMDAGKRPLPGLDARIVSSETAHYPLTVHTTIDAGLQRGIERAMDRLGVTDGAVVVLDADNADVLAMASRPSFDPTNVDLPGGGWSNKALIPATPGSVFKIVVAAAALEAGVVQPNEAFECHGELGKYGFRCWKEGGHGTLTLEEAFAESCNITFAEVMKRLTPEQVEAAARKLGLLSPVGWEGNVGGRPFRQFDGEASGQLFAAGTPTNDEGVLLQTAIGQRDVRITPLQAANMVVSLLHEGEVLEPRAVSSITLKSGKVLETFAEKKVLSPEENGISGATARKLLSWMHEVVETGTATSLQKAKWPLAGKSGTGQVITDGPRTTDNQWFVGFAPADRPRYAIAVLAANVPSDRAGIALELFRSTTDFMADRDALQTSAK
ncbi:peptidoglycan D,D-transpeptidase FtsI family protein [Paenibacillus chartarius]|uniref:Peptidoglycan D,D-transpeptidase FtsI family protein n=1 Tax=Paenibacillus chartarius TaxID=747481 RepID=A0ABV6DIP6_9BACL